MNTKFFGQFLLEKGIINREQLLNGLDEQRKSSPLLGDIAVERQLIDTQQAEKINKEQRRQDKRFGEIAIELEILKEEQVDSLLEEQKKRRKYYGEILVDLGYLSLEALEEQLVAHKQDADETNKKIYQNFDKTDMPRQVNLINEIFTRFYQRMLKLSVSISEILLEQPYGNAEILFWSQKVQSDKNYHIMFAMDSEHACHIASNFLGMEIKEMNELAIDSVNEFLNTFTGHVYSKLGDHSKPQVMPPQHTGHQVGFELSSCTTIKFDSGRFQIQVALALDA